MRSSKTLILVFIAFVVFASAAQPLCVAQQPLGPRETRGKQIYLQGTSPSGKEIRAYIGDEQLEVPGSTMPCASCHGQTGQGLPEGGVIPSNITWETLTKPYGLTHASGRKHPPYTSRAVELALTRGLDPAGNKLLPVMPRYAMSPEDMADLILYLGVVGKDLDPGLTDSSITIGTVLPAKGALAEMGQGIKATMSAVFADVNAAGGIYNRRLELKVAEAGDNAAATRGNFETLLTTTPVFASTGAFVAGGEKELLSLFDQRSIPLVGPFTLYPGIAGLQSRTFHLLSGLDDQVRALVDYSARTPELKKSGLAIVAAERELNVSMVDAVKRQSRTSGLREPQVLTYVADKFDSAGTVKQLQASGRQGVFLLGSSADAMSFMKEAEKVGWFPYIFLPGALTGGDLMNAPAGFDKRIILSFPTSPADHSAAGLNEFRAFVARHQLPSKHVASQIQAYVAAQLLIEGLKRAGRSLSRENLVRALEGLYEHQTGLIPPITYGPNRHIGALGAHIITVDLKQKQFAPAGGWVALDGK